MKLPRLCGLEYWTADQIAESLDYGRHMNRSSADELRKKLWEILDASTSPTPAGGDGPNDVETPDGLLDLANTDKIGHWWSDLSEKQQVAISLAWRDEQIAGCPDDVPLEDWLYMCEHSAEDCEEGSDFRLHAVT